MARALSLDLRQRVVAAIADGISCRQAAARLGVSASSAIRWRALERTTGTPAAKRRGGDQRSQRIEACAPFILGMLEEAPDMLGRNLAGRDCKPSGNCKALRRTPV